MLHRARRIILGSLLAAGAAARAPARRRRTGRPGPRPDEGRDDRQSRLERHRVHGHQHPQDDQERLPGEQREPAHGDDVARRPLRRHRRHARQQGVHHRHEDAAAGESDPDRHRAGASRVLARQPLVLPGQSRRRLDLGDRHAVAEQDQDDLRVRRAAERHLPARRLEGLHRQLRRALGGRGRRAPARAAQEDPGGQHPRRRQARSRQVPRRDQGHQHRRADRSTAGISTPRTATSPSSA